jgi:hypothetical protein
MPTSKKAVKVKKSDNKKQTTNSRIDLVFSGPLLFVPETSNGNITGLEVFAPRNGHHMGAVFLPEVIFTDAELDDPKCERWPVPESFSLLDPHSYTLALTQSGKKTDAPFPVSSIPATNHKILPGRRISADWDVAVGVVGNLSGWTSHRLAQVTEGLFHGGDAPATGSSVASLHRITYAGVTAADFYGAHREARAYLAENVAKGGTLIILGEIPYQSTLLHERKAIDAIAKLAGLDLHLAETAPKPFQTRLMAHILVCGASIVVAP